MVVTHYEVLGVDTDADLEQIRRAYHDQARRLHPDWLAHATSDERNGTPRAMQDVNEAWRVLRDPVSRAAYDRSLAAPESVPISHASPGVDLDRAYTRRAAEPGDLAVALVRAVPWIAVLVVLGAIFVFTAFARSDSSPEELIGRCVDAGSGGTPTPVACDQPNDGRVVLVVERQSRCPSGSDPLAVAGGGWYCLRPPESGS